MNKIVFTFLVTGVVMLGLVVADTFYHLSFSGSFGIAKGKVSVWWNENSAEIPSTKEEVQKWAAAHALKFKYSDTSQNDLIIYLDRVSKSELGLLCHGWDIMGQIGFNADNNVTGKQFWAQSDCVYD